MSSPALGDQPYPDHPGRFQHQHQVLFDKSLYFSRQCFEVEISGVDGCPVTMYRNIDQRCSESNTCTSGNNFSRSVLQTGTWQSDVEMLLKMGVFGRLAVYLNYPSWTL